MLNEPAHPEIEHHTLRFLVGLIALFLAPLTDHFSLTPLASISAAYHAGGWSESIFVGFLFATSAFLLAYNGHNRLEMVRSKVAAVCAIMVALFPTPYRNFTERVPHLHIIAAALMFLILAFFCFSFARTAQAKPSGQAKARFVIYWTCGLAILVTLAVIGIDELAGNGLSTRLRGRLAYFGEYAALLAFGISWLTASRMLPVITAREERLGPLGSAPNGA